MLLMAWMPVASYPRPTARARAARVLQVGRPLPLDRRIGSLRAPFNPYRIVHGAFSVVLTVVLVFTAALAWFWWQSTRPPEWWDAAGVLPTDSSRRAEAIERGLTAALYTTLTHDEPRIVELKAQDANSWLTDRMRKWLANRGDSWPQGLSAPRIAFGDSRISVGVRLLDTEESLSKNRIVSLAFTPALEESGSLRLVDADARIGRARLGGLAADLAALAGERVDPRGTPIEALLEEAGGAALREILLGSRPAMDPALVDLQDGRRVRILGIRVIEDRLRVRYQNEIVTARAAVD